MDDRAVVPAERVQDERVRVLRVDERDRHVRVAEQLVDGIGGLLQQVAEPQIRCDDAADAGDDPQPFCPLLLQLVRAGVLDGDRRVACEIT